MPATSPGSLRARTAMRGRRRSVPASRFQGESVESRPSRRACHLSFSGKNPRCGWREFVCHLFAVLRCGMVAQRISLDPIWSCETRRSLLKSTNSRGNVRALLLIGGVRRTSARNVVVLLRHHLGVTLEIATWLILPVAYACLKD